MNPGGPRTTSLSVARRQRQGAPLVIAHESVQLERALANDELLGAFFYGTPPAAYAGDPRILQVPLEYLDGATGIDLIKSPGGVRRGNNGGFAYACNEDVLVAQIKVAPSQSGGIEAQSSEAYQKIQRSLALLGYPYPLRIWNFIDNINFGEGDDEVYKQFCAGRARGLDSEVDREELLPAASAIGSHNNGRMLVIHLLAAKAPGTQVENPRQVSAFHYPRQYGIRSPSFSRARVAQWHGTAHLYLSGTASVVGHETLHAGDCRAQMYETLRNIDAVLDSVSGAENNALHFGHQHLKQLRVYLRNRNDLAIARSCVQEQLGESVPVAYLLGDICRRDLLVEIEGLYCQTL